MDIDKIKIGDIVIYTGEADDDQINWGSNDDPRKVLKENEEYVIRDIEVHSWHTKIYLIEVVGKFNSVHFKET